MGKRSDIKELPEQKRLIELFSYNQETGELRWKCPPEQAKRIKVGQLAGHLEKNGYRYVALRTRGKYTKYLAHRIIWKIVTGNEPENQVDHIDRNRDNNCWDNLRQASNGQNKANGKIYKNNKSGVKGINWDKSRESWAVTVGTKRICRVKNMNEAYRIRQENALHAYGKFSGVTGG